MNIINVKLCLVILLIELYPFTPLSVTLNIFQCVCVCVRVRACVCFCTPPSEISYLISSFQEKKKVSTGLFSDIITARSFKLCMIMTLLGVFIIILGLMTFNFALECESSENLLFLLLVGESQLISLSLFPLCQFTGMSES